MKRVHMIRRSLAVLILVIVAVIGVVQHPGYQQAVVEQPPGEEGQEDEALRALDHILVKGRAPKTSYERSQFGDGWETVSGCDMRNQILRRDLKNTIVNTKCQVISGTLYDPYTAKTIDFKRGSSTSQAVQVDHVVALSDAWQKGAQQLSFDERVRLANDPLELIAVDGAANQEKGDGDAATWLPPNKAFRCQYVARQIAVKKKYRLWVTPAEKDAMARVLRTCPSQQLPVGV